MEVILYKIKGTRLLQRYHKTFKSALNAIEGYYKEHCTREKDTYLFLISPTERDDVAIYCPACVLEERDYSTSYPYRGVSSIRCLKNLSVVRVKLCLPEDKPKDDDLQDHLNESITKFIVRS